MMSQSPKFSKSPKYCAVYGTLRKDFGNHGCMRRANGKYIGTGKTVEEFQLFASGIPYVTRKVKDTEQFPPSRVVVEIYEPEDWRPLDSLEGYNPNRPEDESGYYRRPTQVELEDGTIVTADLYFYDTRGGHGLEHIPSGDFAVYRSKRYPYA